MNIDNALTTVNETLLDMQTQSLPEREHSLLLIESYYWQFRCYARINQAAPASINMKIIDLMSACEHLLNTNLENQHNDSYYVSEGRAAVDGMKRFFDQNKTARAKAV